MPEPVVCSVAGLVGSGCRAGTCDIGATCRPPDMTSLEVRLGLRSSMGEDPAHAGFVLASASVTGTTPSTAFEGSLCFVECSTASPLSACGSCAACSGRLTQTPLVATLGGIATLGLTGFPGAEGVCRTRCVWAPDGRGDCAMGQTCDLWDGVCVEACVSDADCRAEAALTYDGEIVSAVDATHPRHCSPATGRCEAGGRAGAQVGDPCATDDDCAPGTGVCLPGGLCAELACTSGLACGSNGVCLGVSSTSDQTLCVLGCDVASDCPAGNGCLHFPGGARPPGHVGFCAGTCTADLDCRANETCADLARPGDEPHLACVPPCTPIGAVGAAAGCASREACVLGADTSGPGHCAAIDAFCGAPESASLPAASRACATGWVCDERLAHLADQRERVGDGHCAPACASDADCIAPATCVTSGPLAGLCRAVCTLDVDCSATEVCDATLGRCVEAPRP